MLHRVLKIANETIYTSNRPIAISVKIQAIHVVVVCKGVSEMPDVYEHLIVSRCIQEHINFDGPEHVENQRDLKKEVVP